MNRFGDRIVSPCRAVHGRTRVPGDKSISHRVAMLSALADGESTVHGYLRAADCLNTVEAVKALGASVAWQGDLLRIAGTCGRFRAPAGVLDLGNSGTGMRLLAGLLAGQPFTSEMTGDASLCSRPMGRIREPLERMGAKVELLGAKGCAPIRITGGNLNAITYVLPVASAQVKSCVLFAGLFAEGRTEVVEPKPTRDHTEKLLRGMGAAVRVDGLRIAVEGTRARTSRLRAGRWLVPGDFSSAAFWIVAAACREGSEIVIEGVGLNPRRTALLDVLRRMGADIEVIATGTDIGEPVGTILVKGSRLRATEVGGEEIPNVIDELPVVAVAGAMAEGGTVIRDAAELRVKESDRIAAIVAGLRAFGVEVEERPDGMRIEGAKRIASGDGTVIDSRGDHRIAMSMSILTLFGDAPVRIHDVACVDTSYPGFWDDLAAVAE